MAFYKFIESLKYKHFKMNFRINVCSTYCSSVLKDDVGKVGRVSGRSVSWEWGGVGGV